MVSQNILLRPTTDTVIRKMKSLKSVWAAELETIVDCLARLSRTKQHTNKEYGFFY